jgi:hypothetical protein
MVEHFGVFLEDFVRGALSAAAAKLPIGGGNFLRTFRGIGRYTFGLVVLYVSSRFTLGFLL